MVTSFDIVNQNQSSIIPARQSFMIGGKEFLKQHKGISYSVLERDAIVEILSGNVPEFWKQFVTVSIGELLYLVSPDYLCLGSDDNYIRMPLSGSGAQKVADAFKCSLPTRKMVNDIYAQSKNKLVAHPFGPPYDSSMMSPERIQWMNDRIEEQMIGKDKSELIEGHKKNVVLTNRLNVGNPKKRVAIYGWFQKNGQIIQGLNPDTHEITYFDYSHGIRLIYNVGSYKGQIISLKEAFHECPELLSDEGELTFTSY